MYSNAYHESIVSQPNNQKKYPLVNALDDNVIGLRGISFQNIHLSEVVLH